MDLNKAEVDLLEWMIKLVPKWVEEIGTTRLIRYDRDFEEAIKDFLKEVLKEWRR